FHPLALPTVTPNDTFLNQQWARRGLKARSLWGITAGERLVNGPRKNAVVGMIDFAPDPFHPDLFEVLSQNGFDFVNGQPLSAGLNSVYFSEGHGTNVASTIAV